MKAIVSTKYGLPDVLQLKEIEKPTPSKNEVLIKVYASSVNSWDWDLLRGVPFVNRLMFGLLKPKIILGCDVAGRVEAVGSKVKQFQSGDEVFGDLSRCGWGGFAEYVCASENALAMKPHGLSFEQAAAVPQAALLALQGLFYNGQLQPGQKVLMNGAGGGVGSFAIPMAKSFGAEVTGVDCSEKVDFIHALGADQVIDFNRQDFTQNGQHYDLILDVAAYRSIADYKRALSPKGAYVMIGGSSALANQLLLLGPWISITTSKKMGVLLHKANKGLDLMTELFEGGKITPILDKCYPLSDVAEALRYFGTGHAKGKVVISVANNDNN